MADSNVHDLGPREGESVVSILTDLLGHAQRGEITSIACAITWSDRTVGSITSRTDRAWALIGATSAMHWRMVQRQMTDPSHA
jgi:hypothetical protein